MIVVKPIKLLTREDSAF